MCRLVKQKQRIARKTAVKPWIDTRRSSELYHDTGVEVAGQPSMEDVRIRGMLFIIKKGHQFLCWFISHGR